MPDFGGSVGLGRAEMAGEGGAADGGGSVLEWWSCFRAAGVLNWEGGRVWGGWNGWGCVGDLGFWWRNRPPGTESPSGYGNTLPVDRIPRDSRVFAGLGRADMSEESGAAFEGGRVAELQRC